MTGGYQASKNYLTVVQKSFESMGSKLKFKYLLKVSVIVLKY